MVRIIGYIIRNVYLVKKWIKQNILLLLMLLLLPVFFYFKNILSYINTQLDEMKNNKEKINKIIVFDLDETLGYFTELSIFWDALEQFYGHNLFDDKFFEALDVFPEFFRPEMLNILKFINKKKKRKICYKTFIYTNNQGAKSWVKMISDYCDNKLGYKTFDHIIGAYKIRGKQIEPKRTSHDKSVKDLISCANIKEHTEFCFIDDLYHPLMDKENVNYINIKPYHCSLPFDEMANRYYKMVINKKTYNGPPVSQTDFEKFIVDFMKQYNYTVAKKGVDERNVDKVVSKKLLSNLDDFLKRERNADTRKKRNIRTKTKRNNNK